MLSTSLLAQQAAAPTSPAPVQTPAAAPAATLTPAPVTTNPPAAAAVVKKKAAPKKAPVKKAAAKKKVVLPELRTVPLVPGPAVVVASNVNVRGQAKLKSEVVTQVTKDQTVMVIEEIVRNNSGPQEPSAWAKIALPPKAHVWVHRMFINPATQAVLPRRLNLRSGPGENYSVIGLLKRGDVVKAITTKEDWVEIEPPADAYAFVAAQYLRQEGAAVPTEPVPPATAVTVVPPVPAPPEPAPTPATVEVVPPVAPPPTEAPSVPVPEPPVVATTPEVPAEPETPEFEEPPPPRIVQREGIVRGMTSIQAPSRFALVSPDNGRNIDYLYTTSDQLDLRRYKGLRIVVTGEESLDERWGNTPVLTIQKIQVVEE